MWAVLTDPEKKGGKWEAAEFFRTGEAHISGVLAELEGLGVSLNYGCALDFGCGVGRLTQALAGRFAEVHGVDIAPSMVEQAERFNRFPQRCHYHLNSRSDLKMFEDGKFDFLCTFIALQHIEARYVLDYVREFVRILRPQGVAVFQLLEPSLLRRLVPSFLITGYRKWRYRGRPYVWEFGVTQARIDQLLRETGCRVLQRRREPCRNKGWNALTYTLSRSISLLPF